MATKKQTNPPQQYDVTLVAPDGAVFALGRHNCLTADNAAKKAVQSVRNMVRRLQCGEYTVMVRNSAGRVVGEYSAAALLL